ncbi:MAG TPA: cytochrome b/b6 domain-containing protein [Pantanalinema sp.]
MNRLERFCKSERFLHWMIAAAVAVFATTGWFIWRHEDDWEINGINVISQSHVILGGLLLVLGVVGYLLLRRRSIPFAKARFSLGQRVGLGVTQLAMSVLVLSGATFYFRQALELSKPARKMVMQVHLYGAVALLLFVVVHLAMVLLMPKNRGILAGMLTGTIDRKVAVRVSSRWVAFLEGSLPQRATPASRSDG